MFAVVIELESPDPAEIHDDRAMNAAKPITVQIAPEFRQRAAQEVRVVPRVQTGVVGSQDNTTVTKSVTQA